MKKSPSPFFAGAAFFLILLTKSFAQPPTISYQPVITGLSAPVDLVNAGDGTGRLFVVEQSGMIRSWNGTSLSNFLNLGASGLNLISFGGERGLLSLAFHPDFDGVNNRYFFVYYTDLNGDIAIRRFQTLPGNSDLADVATGQIILTIPHPGQNNHNGGKLNFGPDGNLYFATGDGGGGNDVPNNAQNKMSLLGKMIRINVDDTLTPPFYQVPASNPYVGDATFDSRIYDLGLRNPFRWSFDRANGDMWIGDVGQGTKEEIDYRPAASTGHNNFGWRCFEGYIPTPGVTPCSPTDNVYPVYDYDRNLGSTAVTGGYVYRGTEYPNFRGYYVATDVYSGTLYFLWSNGSGGFDSSLQTGLQNFVVGFGEAEDGTLYAVSQGTNTVYKLVATGGTPLPVSLTSFSGQSFPGHNEVRWSTSFEQNTLDFQVEYSMDRRSFSAAGVVAAKRNSSGGDYFFSHRISTPVAVFYRLAIRDDNGSVKYSSILKLNGDFDGALRIYPTIIQNGIINFNMTKPVTGFQLINSNGTVVFEKNMQGLSGSAAINLPQLPKGLYYARLSGAGIQKTEKILMQ